MQREMGFRKKREGCEHIPETELGEIFFQTHERKFVLDSFGAPF